MGELIGKIALIAGVEDAVGQEIALLLASECVAIGMVYGVDPRYANEALARIDLRGGRAISIRADLSNAASVTSLFDDILSRLGGLDLVATNLSIAADAVAPDTTPEEYARIIGMAFQSVRPICLEAARRLPDGGRIVHFASIQVHRASETQEGYLD